MARSFKLFPCTPYIDGYSQRISSPSRDAMRQLSSAQSTAKRPDSQPSVSYLELSVLPWGAAHLREFSGSEVAWNTGDFIPISSALLRDGDFPMKSRGTDPWSRHRMFFPVRKSLSPLGYLARVWILPSTESSGGSSFASHPPPFLSIAPTGIQSPFRS